MLRLNSVIKVRIMRLRTWLPNICCCCW